MKSLGKRYKTAIGIGVFFFCLFILYIISLDKTAQLSVDFSAENEGLFKVYWLYDDEEENNVISTPIQPGRHEYSVDVPWRGKKPKLMLAFKGPVGEMHFHSLSLSNSLYKSLDLDLSNHLITKKTRQESLNELTSIDGDGVSFRVEAQSTSWFLLKPRMHLKWGPLIFFCFIVPFLVFSVMYYSPLLKGSKKKGWVRLNIDSNKNDLNQTIACLAEHCKEFKIIRMSRHNQGTSCLCSYKLANDNTLFKTLENLVSTRSVTSYRIQTNRSGEV